MAAALGMAGIAAVPAGLNAREPANPNSAARIAHELAVPLKPEARPDQQAPKPPPGEAPRPAQNPVATPQPAAPKEEPWLTTLPGIIAAVATLITAITGLVVALRKR